ncbi:MAG: lipoate--protein ligase family protein [Deltaproteobacteria bacterium]|nr:lipoate--protein ligase family protein [Deltaproteobacteria bacterium]
MRARRFRVLQDGPGPADWNMSVDEALLLEAPVAGPVLRFYAWRAPAVSLGYRQAAPGWLDRCDALGVEVVRRVTGGGAVLHANDLTYAVIAPPGTPPLPDDLSGSYGWIRARLLEGLRAAGFSARAAVERAGASRLELCFAGATGYEVELDGRKLIGSAQRRTPFGLLQHGSIRICDDSALYRAVTGSEPAPVPRPGIDAAALRRAITDSFEAALGARLEPASLSPAERVRAEARMAQRWSDPLRAPALSLRRFPEAADRIA